MEQAANVKYVRDPALKRRNRIVAVIVLLAALAASVSGTLYLRHYGFSQPHQKEIRFH